MRKATQPRFDQLGHHHDLRLADPVLPRLVAPVGERLITRPAGFFGTQFARFQDPSANIWWVRQHWKA